MDKAKILQMLKEIFSMPYNPTCNDGKTLIPTVTNCENTEYQNGSLISLHNDSNISLTLPEPVIYAIFEFNIDCEIPDVPIQVFYKQNKDDSFEEEKSFILGKANGTPKLRVIEFDFPVQYIRLDPVNVNAAFSINYFEIRKVSQFYFSYIKPLKICATLIKNKNSSDFIKKIKTDSLKDAMLQHVNINEFNLSNNVNCYKFREPIFSNEINNEINTFNYKPLISVVIPVYNVAPVYLKAAIDSIEKQWYSNWEICIADDASTNKQTLKYLKKIRKNSKINVTFLKNNVNISGASNAALQLAKGDFIALMDNDDEITPNAFFEVVKAINNNQAEFIYSDEDKLEEDGTFSTPHFKPDFSPEMFLSHNYMSHLSVIKHSIIKEVNGWTLGVEGAQDYDLYLKVLEKTDKIYHIPKVLYHWRKIPGSTAVEFSDKLYAQEAGRQSLENAMKRRGIRASVSNGITAGSYKVNYKIKGKPLVSIIIPFKDKPELLRMCIQSIINQSTYKNFEIIGISNNSETKECFSEMDRLKQLDNRIHFYEYNVPFNYSAINNHAVYKHAKGEYVLFLNNDIEIITQEWIEEMLMHAQRNTVGCVGTKLYFPNDKIQHAGLTLAPNTSHAVNIVYGLYPRNENGYFARLKCISNYSAVTAACLMCSKEKFKKINGFDEKLAVAYNDVDLCLNFLDAGFLNVFTPFAEAYHHESASRGYEEKLPDIERREQEKYIMKSKHSKKFINPDPFYSPNLSRYSQDFQLDPKFSLSPGNFLPQDFTHKILKRCTNSNKSKNRILIFSHFSRTSTIDDYVIYYLKHLSKLADIIFVSTAENLPDSELKKISTFTRTTIVKQNYGYDFGAWKTGLNELGDELNKYQELILCNDSVFGPLYDLEPIFKQMNEKAYDIWGMSDNFEIDYHLQSFFIVYSKKAFTHKVFKDIWNNFKIFIDKQTLIENCEIGFSRKLQDTELKISSYCCAEDFNSYLNITHYYWQDMILKKHYPFIKKELLRDNPMNIDISEWKNIIKKNTDYPVKLITEHLNALKNI
jgi:glycosyltransferase involved in cell wall biosynthesis